MDIVTKRATKNQNAHAFQIFTNTQHFNSAQVNPARFASCKYFCPFLTVWRADTGENAWNFHRGLPKSISICMNASPKTKSKSHPTNIITSAFMHQPRTTPKASRNFMSKKNMSKKIEIIKIIIIMLLLYSYFGGFASIFFECCFLQHSGRRGFYHYRRRTKEERNVDSSAGIGANMGPNRKGF